MLEVMFMAKKVDANWCGYWTSGRRRFPTVPVLLLAIGILWLLSEIEVITIQIPWWPVILIVIALGWLINNYKK